MIEVYENQHTGGQANGQTEYVDERKYFALHEVTPGNLQVILHHDARSLG
jgi:hypothetical protein